MLFDLSLVITKEGVSGEIFQKKKEKENIRKSWIFPFPTIPLDHIPLYLPLGRRFRMSRHLKSSSNLAIPSNTKSTLSNLVIDKGEFRCPHFRLHQIL